jgi:hypothetical protein
VGDVPAGAGADRQGAVEVDERSPAVELRFEPPFVAVERTQSVPVAASIGW